MKLILDAEKMFKLTISQEGQLSVALANGKQFAGPLTAAELEQLMFRVTAITDGAITCDPMSNDYIGMHDSDVKTLEAQSLAISELRETIAARDVVIDGHQEALARLTDCETELGKARTELREALRVVEVQAAKLNIVKQADEDITEAEDGDYPSGEAVMSESAQVSKPAQPEPEETAVMTEASTT